ncbi:hypothetical protein ANN_01999 [Periplaneta americana]|uniref:Uncharacterized protein n=1 Tax=Periplaneta americana TaxID=6978 RepID=A0ABQ8TY17_PERAM|nr:hypothetical protein ANN_01999 [Periplaneta americana]
MLAGSEFQSLGRAIVKEDEYEEVRWDGIDLTEFGDNGKSVLELLPAETKLQVTRDIVLLAGFSVNIITNTNQNASANKSCYTWSLTKGQLRRIEAAEMRLLRPLAGYTLHDHKRNADIRTELNITAFTDTMESYRNNWYEHVLRMPNNRLPKRLLDYTPRGKRASEDQGRAGKTNFLLEVEQARTPDSRLLLMIYVIHYIH